MSIGLSLVIILVFFSCNDVFEKDISGASVTLLTPKDSIFTQQLQQNFRWEEVDEALFYRLQISSPNFISPDFYVLDTVLKNVEFTYTLTGGYIYQWRVMAMNGSSETEYQTRTISTDTTGLLTDYRPVLIAPNQGFITNEVNLKFEWEEIPNASDYLFEIRANTEEPQMIPGMNFRVDTPSITLESVPEGDFLWYVQGHNEYSVTRYAFRQIMVDTTAPNTPTILAPLNADTIKQFPAVLEWEADNNQGSQVINHVEIYADSTLVGEVYSMDTVEEELELDTLANGSYYWRVYSVDKAGNSNNLYSQVNLFVVE